MKFDLTGPRCVNEYEYCQLLASLSPMFVEDGPQDVSLSLMFLTQPVDTNGLDLEGARTGESDREMPLEWNAPTWKTRHPAEAMVRWNHPEAQFNVIRRDQLCRVYVGLNLFWEDWEIHLRCGRRLYRCVRT